VSNSADEVKYGYSPKTMRRLLGYLKPYKFISALALLALIIATGAELYLPVILKRTLDENLLRRENRVTLRYVKKAWEDNGTSMLAKGIAESLMENGVEIDGSLFVNPQLLSNLNEQDRNTAMTAGWLDSDDWYLIQNPDDAALNVIESNPRLFLVESQNSSYAMRIIDRNKLPVADQLILRSNDIVRLKSRSLQYLLFLLGVLSFSFVQVYLASWIGQKIMADIRQGLLTHLVRQSLHYLGKTLIGSLVSRIANDVETINEFFTNVTISLMKDGAIMIGVFIALFLLDSHLALIALAASVPILILFTVFQRSMKETFRQVRARVSSVNAYLSEKLGGMSTVQLFNAQSRSRTEFLKKGNDLLDAELKQIKIMAIFRPIIDLIASIVIALIIWYFAGLHNKGLISLGVLIAFIELIRKFFQPVRDIAEKFNILQSAITGGERIFEMIDTVDCIKDENSLTTELLTGQIKFENVHFSYVPGEPVIRGLSFQIQTGQTVAVVGATGSGKTTIANLITRFWDPDAGRILMDGRDIRNISLSSLRQMVQPVQQDVFLFAGSVADNINLGLNMSKKKIIEAAQLSRADQFVRELPRGYDTSISEGAGNLSAGQRQLIAFARIIAHNPRVIILDEATANIDTETEKLLQAGVENLLRNRTAIIVAHRLSTIKLADRIMVLGHGILIEEGTHEELIQKRGVYSNLYKLQFATDA